MKVPVSWLREYVPVEMPLRELADRLVISTCEVPAIETVGVPDTDGNLGLFRVGRVVEAGKHPNADRLQLCHVDVGEDRPRQIVCGAWNFGAGATVAVALPGAVLPGGQRLERAKLRGEVSDGMILSERELALGDDHAGILVLPEPWEPGTPLGDVAPVTDAVLELETGHNRPDLLAVYGIAREVAALFDLPLEPPPGDDPARAGDEPVDVRIEDFEGCPRYVGRLFRDVSVGPSPLWLKARLNAAGMRPISNVVDVTNYVMLALGNPLHAFDLATLAGGRVVVRRARAGETLRTLDGVERDLEEHDLLIADAERPVALAGIMGGEETEIGPATSDVLLEAANFEPYTTFRTSERLRLRTEGSNRWEKGVDPHLAGQAAKLATQLLVELAGAGWTGETDVHAGLPERPVVRFHPARTDAVTGIETPAREQHAILRRLGFQVDGERVVVPTWRARDVTREIDLVEEVARFRLDDVPPRLPTRQAMFGRLSRAQRVRRRVQDVLVGFGYAEVYSWSLLPEDAEPEGVRLQEPITSEQAVLRTSLLDGLIASARRNVDAGNERIALFELAHVYLPTGERLPEERWRVGGITEGGFARAKGAVEGLYEALAIEPSFEPASDLRRPGPGARTREGWVLALRDPELPGDWGAFELDVDGLLARVPELVVYEDVITYPPVNQDLAFSVGEDVPAGALVAAAHEAAGPELREMVPFDVYRGEQVGPGRKSIAFAVTFQSPDRTLSDEDAAALRERIVSALASRFGAALRA
ncbi:MAG: phenylalanine--tRNA ligase subunit beta [Actinomycetota bacterium]|nr:phenylalanine--tRNA ligase subunit beta [Actinomycetota bacterium]